MQRKSHKLKLLPIITLGVFLVAFISNLFLPNFSVFANNKKCAQWSLKVGNDIVQTDQFCATVDSSGNITNGTTSVNHANSGYGIISLHSSGYNSSKQTLFLDCRTGWHPVTMNDCGGVDGSESSFVIKDGNAWTSWTSLISDVEHALNGALIGEYDGKNHSDLTYTGDYFTNSVADSGNESEVVARTNLAGYDENGRVNGWTDQASCKNGELSVLISEALSWSNTPSGARSTLQSVQHNTDDFAQRKAALLKFYDKLLQQQESQINNNQIMQKAYDALKTKIDGYKNTISNIESNDAEPCPDDSHTDYYAEASANTINNSNGTNNTCYSNATGIGWIVCPVTDFLFDTLNELFSWIEQDFLKIDASGIFNANPDEGVYAAWSAFRDVANILFVILLMVVIFSQLTGVGIDNYGIKKILPKIIIVAILINLSYLVCQLAVDISNIIGVSLKEFLVGLAPPFSDNAASPQGTERWVFAGILGSGIAIGASLALVGSGMVLAIIGAAIAAVVGTFFLWVILVVRQAGVVLAIVLAPLAIACYLLPNTQSLGKRWLDIFKALLILYPLCSLVIGAGALASSILGNVDNDGMRLAAMLVQVIPFFFIPTLLRRSLDGMGNIGAKINGFSRTQGRNLGGRARQGLNNTNFAQNRRFNAMQRRTGLRIGAANYANGNRGNRLTRGLAGLVGGSRQTQSRLLGARDKMEAQELAGSRLLARQDLGRAEARFNELANSENLSRAEQNELNGIISEFANTPGYANKIVKKISSGEASAAFTQAVATHAANNSDVSAAINGKNAVMARYLADVANGNSGVSASTSFNAYDTEDKRAEVAAGMSDREVASQSAESMRNLLNTDPARISRIAQNDKIMGDIDAENAELIRDSQTAEGIADGGKIYHTSGMRGDAIKKFNQQHNLDISNSGWNKQNGSVKIYEKTENGKTYIFNAQTGDISVV